MRDSGMHDHASPAGPLSLATDYRQLRGSVFVVTYGRSGSTVLQRILQTLPHSCIRGENSNTLGKLFEAQIAAETTRRNFGQDPRGRKDPWHGADHISPDRFGQALTRAFVSEILKPYPSVRYIGFKEIRWYWTPQLDRFLDFILRYFPDPVFVFSSRRAEDVAQSAWWAKQPDQARATVAHLDRFFDDYTRRRPDRVVRTRYEEFTADPLALKPVFDHFNERIDADLVAQILSDRLPH